MTTLKPILLCLAAIATFAAANVVSVATAPGPAPAAQVAAR
ncbi:hypothetical protein [Rubrivirga sp. IMCC45206]